MTPRNTLFSHSHSPHVSELCTEKEFIVVDLTEYIRYFCEDVDRSVESLSYDIPGILTEYTSFKGLTNLEKETIALADTLIHKGYVKVNEDAPIIAEMAIDILYRSITRHIKDLGYIMGVIHNHRIRLNPRNQQLSCTAIMMVI